MVRNIIILINIIMFCPICYEELDKTKTIVMVCHHKDNMKMSRHLGHYFHRVCLQRWKKDSKEFLCPLDRVPIRRMYNVPDYQINGLSPYNDYRELLGKLRHNNLEVNDDVNRLDSNQKTVAYYACQTGNFKLVRNLFRQKADFNLGNGRHNFTPLMMAVCQGCINIVRFLLAQPSVREACKVHDRHGFTAFGYACKYSRPLIIQEFLKYDRLIEVDEVSHYLRIYYKKYQAEDKIGKIMIQNLIDHIQAIR